MSLTSHILLPRSQYEADFADVAPLDCNYACQNDLLPKALLDSGTSETCEQDLYESEKKDKVDAMTIETPPMPPEEALNADAAIWCQMLADCLDRQLQAAEQALDAGITQPAKIWTETSQWLREHQGGGATAEEFKSKLREYLRRDKKAAKNRIKRQKKQSS